MTEVRMIGIEPAKRSFQLRGVRADDSAAFRKQVSRGWAVAETLPHPHCAVAMEACASAQDRGREVFALGHRVRPIPPVCARPFVKRWTNAAVGAEAVCEATLRPAMRFVAAKGAEQQAHGVAFRARDLPARQRTQPTDAFRGRLAEFGIVVSRGPAHAGRLAQEAEAAGSEAPGPCAGRGCA